MGAAKHLRLTLQAYSFLEIVGLGLMERREAWKRWIPPGSGVLLGLGIEISMKMDEMDIRGPE